MMIGARTGVTVLLVLVGILLTQSPLAYTSKSHIQYETGRAAISGYAETRAAGVGGFVVGEQMFALGLH